MIQEAVPIPVCFSSTEKKLDDDDDDLSPFPHPPPSTTNISITNLSRSPQTLSMSVYRTNIAGQSRLVTITWCKNLLLHGLSVSVSGPEGSDRFHQHQHCKVELKPWYFWRKLGSKRFNVEDGGKTVDVVWDLKAAKFNGEVEPQSDYYVALVSEEEVVLVVGDMKKEAFRRTSCRPALEDPVLVSKREHMFGKRRFSTRVKFHERDQRSREVSVEWRSGSGSGGSNNSSSPEMEIRIDGELAVEVKHLQWKFRGNVWIDVEKTKVEVCWDVHDWIFGSGPRHALFLFKPMIHYSSSNSSPSSSPFLSPEPEGDDTSFSPSAAGKYGCYGSEFCLFLYAWKIE